jgi:hypothetical protein
MYTHTTFYFFNENYFKKEENPQIKEEKKPTHPKIYTKILPRPPGFRMYAQRRGRTEGRAGRTGGSIQELLLHHGACSDHPSCC